MKRIQVGCEFRYTSTWPTPATVLVQSHDEGAHRLRHESWETGGLPIHGFSDLYGNRCQRVILPEGESVLRYDALIDVPPETEDVNEHATQARVEDLPDDVLFYTLPSRYCFSDQLSNTAWELFGGTEPGWARVQAVCDWIHENIMYGHEYQSTPLTTAVDIYEARAGVCRDFAHLGVTFCRALNIPARYVFGYMPDIDIDPPYPAMDFHAWFEVYLSGRWWTRDARFNVPRIGRIPVGRGRDAVDVAMLTSYGPARFLSMTVVADEVATTAQAVATESKGAA